LDRDTPAFHAFPSSAWQREEKNAAMKIGINANRQSDIASVLGKIEIAMV
jgi:hypothetical protein